MNIIIDDLSALNPAPNQWVAIDLEIFTKKGDVNHLHRPHTGQFACLSVCYDDTNVFVYTNSDYVSPVLEKLQCCVWVFQNGKFDITHLRRWATIKPRKKYFDTMFIERILYNGLYDSFSLKSLARRYLGIELSKEARETFEGATELTREQIEYAANDPLVTLQIALKQKKLMDKDDIYIWSEIDRPALWAFLDFQGFAIDVDKWVALAEKNKAKQTELDALIPFNPRSPKQVVEWLSKHGFKGLKDSQEATLEKFIYKFPDTEAAQVARDVLDNRMYGKRASTYGTKFIEEYLEYDDGVPIIYTNYDISRAETGRTASSDPNLQNIPARETKDFRYCFVARPGNKIIVADYSAQEPRLSAVASQDEKLLEWFGWDSIKSVYIELAREVFGKSITKKDTEYAKMKSTILGLNYGMSEAGLAEREGISKEEARELIRDTLTILPGLASYMDKQRTNKKMVKTLFGRKVWLNPYSGQVERNALNAPIQGSAADMMKKALASIHQNWKFDYPFAVVGSVHDEIISDVPEEIAEDVAHFIKKQMETVATEMVNNQIPFLADVSIGSTWADK
jgi:DNA polymerase I